MNDHAAAQMLAPTIELAPLDVASAERVASLALAVGRLEADYVLPAPPDLLLPSAAMVKLTAAVAADPGANAFRLAVAGPSPDALWRGRRPRSHERNLESLRFANLIPFGGLLVRREALLEALAGLPPDAGDDWWRIVCRRLAQTGPIAELDLALRRKTPMEAEPAAPSFVPLPRSAARVLVLGQLEVSTSLYFDFLETAPDVSVGFRPLTRLALDAPMLAAADLVILVRELHRFWDEGVIAFLDAAHVPYVWFTDDNFVALRAEHDAKVFYSPSRMRIALGGAAAVWASTDALAAAHAGLHPKVAVWKPVLDRTLQQSPPPISGDVITVALPGGDFRLPGLTGVAMDGLRQVAEGGLRLVVTSAGGRMLGQALPRAEVVVLPMERSFRQHIHAWRRFSPDILLHPAGATANAAFKTPTAAIVASYLGAVPVVADEPAYQGWGEAEGVLRLGVNAEGLALAASRARQADWRAEMAQRLAGALSARFGPDGRVGRLMALARPSPLRNATAVAENILESPAFARRQAVRRLIHHARPIIDRFRRPG